MPSLRWSPDEDTLQAVTRFIESMHDHLPDILQMAEFIQGCIVTDLSPYAPGVLTFPRLIQVQLRGEYITDVRYREDLGLELGDTCIVVRFREGEQYEIYSAGGSTGGGTVGLWPGEATDPHGFENRIDSAISFVNGTRTFAITGTYNFWNQGNKFIGTGDSGIVPAFTDWYWYYYDTNGLLDVSTSPVVMNSRTFVAYVYWNNTLSEGVLFEERHGISMDFATHYYLHNTIGTKVQWGFDIGGYTLKPAVPADADNTYSISTGYLADEDISIFKAALPDNGPYTIWHRTGVAGVWRWTTGLAVPFINGVGTYIQYNQWTGATWQMTTPAASEYINYFVFVTMSTNADHRHIIVPGQHAFANLDDASNETLGDLVVGEFPVLETGTLYRVTYRTSNGYVSTGKCRIELVTSLLGESSVSITNLTPPTSHAALADRDLANQHPGDAVFVDITGYSGILNVVGLDDVQAAMDTLDAQACDKDAAETISALWTYDAGVVIDGGAIFNEPGADVDFRVESDTKTHALFVQGSDGNVGIGTAAPAALIHVLGNDANAGALISAGKGNAGGYDATIAGGFWAGVSMQPFSNITDDTNGYFGGYMFAGVNVVAGKTLSQLAGMYVDVPTKTGTGTIDYAYGLYVNAPTIGSVNVAAYLGGNVGIGTAAPGSLLELNLATEDLEFVDAGSVGATEQDWIQVKIGGVTGYIHVFPGK